MVTGPVLPPKEGDAWGHVPRLGEQPLANGPFRTGESITRGQAEEALPRTRPACENPNPVWECTSSSLGKDAVGAQDGTTSKKATVPEPPARSRTEILGLD